MIPHATESKPKLTERPRQKAEDGSPRPRAVIHYSTEESRRPLHALSSGEALLGTGINRQCCANSPVGDAYQRLWPNNA